MKVVDFNKTIYRGIKLYWRKYHFLVPPEVLKKNMKYLWSILKGRTLPYYNPIDKSEYNLWLKENEKNVVYKKLEYRPLISVLIPVYNVDGKYLKECIESVLMQKYDNFEICIVDDASTKRETLKVLKEYENNKKIKIKYRKKNGHISRATNDALKMAEGEFVALMDNDDVIPENALYEVVKVLNKDKKIDIIYTDEDKLDENGVRCYPYFKPDWSPDTLMSLNYICHLLIIKTNLINKVKGFTVGLEGAQDHDLLLKVTEKTDKIYHIPKILYHWRMIPGSTAQKIENKDYASDKGKMAIENAIVRRKLNATVEKDLVSTYYRVRYILKEEPLISIIVPMKDYANVTEKCLESIYKKTTYKNFEVVLVNNRSEEEASYKLFEKYKKEYDNFQVIDADMEFNYSKINNYAVRCAKGEFIVLLNNDTQIITPDWLELMVGYAARPTVGAVGVKLLYPDDTIQHVGVIIGMGGVAGHSFLGVKRDDPGMYGLVRVPYNVGAVTAACLCVEKKKFDEVGGLNEDLKVAFNDIDLNMKLSKRGYRNIVLPMVELYHYESKSRGTDLAPGKRERFEQEVKYMQKKWGKKLERDEYYNSNLSLKHWYVLEKKKDE